MLFRYEQKLTQEREVGLRLKGENGILKKKALAFQKDLEDQKEEIRELFEKKKDLYQTIASLEKDIGSLKKEIKERDETIGDKEKRIYDLKKKNQVRSHKRGMTRITWLLWSFNRGVRNAC